MTRIPPLFGQIEFRYETRVAKGHRLFASTDLLGAWKQSRLSPEDETDVRIPVNGTPAWRTWNVGVGTTVFDHYQLLLRIENLLNQKYKLHGSGLYGPGTNVVLTARAFF